MENISLIIINVMNMEGIFICHFSDNRLQIFASPGENVSLPCHLNPTGFAFGGTGNRIKWTKLDDANAETDVLISMGFHKITYGHFQNHVHLQEADDNDATLIITKLDLSDFGTYKCEIINAMDDVVVEIELRMRGKQICQTSL